MAPHSLQHTPTYIHTHYSYPPCIPHSFGQAVIIVLRIAFIHQVGTEVVQCIDQNTGAAAVHSAKAHALVTPTHSFFAVGLAWHAWQLPMALLAGGSVSSGSETCQTAAVQKLVRDVNITSIYYETGIFRHTFAFIRAASVTHFCKNSLHCTLLTTSAVRVSFLYAVRTCCC